MSINGLSSGRAYLQGLEQALRLRYSEKGMYNVDADEVVRLKDIQRALQMVYDTIPPPPPAPSVTVEHLNQIERLATEKAALLTHIENLKKAVESVLDTTYEVPGDYGRTLTVISDAEIHNLKDVLHNAP